MNYEDQLMNDLQSGSESENEDETARDVEDVVPAAGGHGSADKSPQSFDEKLEAIFQKPVSLQEHIDQFDLDVQDISHRLQIPPIMDELRQKLGQFSAEESDFLALISHSDYDNDEFQFLTKINQLTSIIHDEIDLVFRFVKFKYKIVFPELESILPSPLDYARVVLTIKQDLASIKTFEKQFASFLSSEKILVLIMSGLHSMKGQFILSDEDLNVILNNCDIILRLNTLLEDMSKVIQAKLIKFVPNLNNLVGSLTSSQLLMSCGSLSALSSTPSCNIPSLGVRQLAGQNKSVKAPLQMGYLYYNDMIRFLPPEVQRPAMRILSGKVILAARIDLAKSDSAGTLGAKYKEETTEKITKLLAPPEATADKALPVPTEYKSKRRGGRRIRKMKQKFQMSEIAKAQNKMEFGKEEQSYLNNFGEEIGLGMMKASNLQVNTNTKASMSNAMRNRLNIKKETKTHLDTFLDNDFDQIIFNKPASDTPQNGTSKNKWFKGMSKDEPSHKKQKL